MLRNIDDNMLPWCFDPRHAPLSLVAVYTQFYDLTNALYALFYDLTNHAMQDRRPGQ